MSRLLTWMSFESKVPDNLAFTESEKTRQIARVKNEIIRRLLLAIWSLKWSKLMLQDRDREWAPNGLGFKTLLHHRKQKHPRTNDDELVDKRLNWN